MKADVEIYLLTRGDWVPSEEICQRFGVNERNLRCKGNLPGLCSDFAISGDRGFKHVRCATPQEFERFVARLKTHALGELSRIEILETARRNVQTGQPAFEKFSGQGLLPVRF